jgi:hypothetical protein
MGNKYATGRKTKEPLRQIHVSAPKVQIEAIGVNEATDIAKKATREAILTAFQNKIK